MKAAAAARGVARRVSVTSAREVNIANVLAMPDAPLRRPFGGGRGAGGLSTWLSTRGLGNYPQRVSGFCGRADLCRFIQRFSGTCLCTKYIRANVTSEIVITR